MAIVLGPWSGVNRHFTWWRHIYVQDAPNEFFFTYCERLFIVFLVGAENAEQWKEREGPIKARVYFYILLTV